MVATCRYRLDRFRLSKVAPRLVKAGPAANPSSAIRDKARDRIWPNAFKSLDVFVKKKFPVKLEILNNFDNWMSRRTRKATMYRSRLGPNRNENSG
jgi:hypothetical protein